jgi:hypothetical protein
MRYRNPIPAHGIDHVIFSAQICLRLNLNPHLLEQTFDLHNRQKRPMLLKSLPSLHMPYQMLEVLVQMPSNIYAQLVNLLQSSPSCLLQRMIDIVECAIYLFAQIFGELFGDAIPAT